MKQDAHLTIQFVDSSNSFVHSTSFDSFADQHSLMDRVKVDLGTPTSRPSFGRFGHRMVLSIFGLEFSSKGDGCVPISFDDEPIEDESVEITIAMAKDKSGRVSCRFLVNMVSRTRRRSGDQEGWFRVQ